MSIWSTPCRFNFRKSPLLGNSFVHYFTHTYSGHQRIWAELRGDQADYRVMLRHTLRREGRKRG